LRINLTAPHIEDKSYSATDQVQVLHQDRSSTSLTSRQIVYMLYSNTDQVQVLHQVFTNACVDSDSMSMFRKIEAGWKHQGWLVSLRRSNLVSTSFMSVQGHAGVRGNEKADRLAGTV
jgi:hypothetical protein